MHIQLRMFPVLPWFLIILTVHLTAPITDASLNDVPGTFEREIDGLAGLAREQRSVDDLDAVKKTLLQSRSEGPKCFLETRPSVGVFKRVDDLLEVAENAEGECQDHLLNLIEEQANGIDISKKATHEECLSKCGDSEESKKSCSVFLPKPDKYYHKLVVKSKTTGKRFGVCVRTASFDADDNHEKGIFNSKKECKEACHFLGAGTSTQKRSKVSLDKRAGTSTQKRSKVSVEKRADCTLFPCENGGTCINGTCLCPSGYDGESCQNKKCIPACQNSGVCNKGVCKCTEHYEGVSCETAICTCQNGGTCKDPIKKICECSPGYFGDQCGNASCIPFCQNGGTCSKPNTCSCPFVFQGPTCNISKCADDPGNRGSCEFNRT